jgi:hypothetical protein
MALFDPGRAAATANEDGEFRIAARFMDGDLCFDVGPDAYHVEVRGGRITSFAPLADGAQPSWMLRLSAPEETWREMLVPTPRPFFHDFQAASFREGLVVEGDVVQFGPYYRAVARLIEIMRTQKEA